MKDILVKIRDLLSVLLAWLIKVFNREYVYATTEYFTGTGGAANVRVAHITPNTPAIWVPDVGKHAETEPSKYLPAMTPGGKITQQGYYSTVEKVFVSAYPPVRGNGSRAGDYNIDW